MCSVLIVCVAAAGRRAQEFAERIKKLVDEHQVRTAARPPCAAAGLFP
jgi:hypothetical protein